MEDAYVRAEMHAVGLLAQTSESLDDALGVAQTIIEYAGTIAFAISAAMLAGRRKMNVVGVVVFSVIVAIGGGTTRDLLLGELPVYWVDNPTPLLVAAIAATATIPLFNLGTISLMRRYDLIRVFDSAGLALFTVLGTNTALDSGAGNVSAVFIGTIAGVGGGIIRDTIAEKIPAVLKSGNFYAFAALTGAALDAALLEASLAPTIASTIAVAYILAVRLLSIHFGWGPPKFEIDTDGDGKPDTSVSG